MNILRTIPTIEGSKYLGINLTVCIGVNKGHFVVEFRNLGGGYYPVIIADEKSEVSFDRKELKNMTNWIDKTCAELDRMEKEWEKIETIKD